MKSLEFAEVMAYISAATTKPLSPEAAEVYYDLLGDLPAEVLRVAAKRVVLEHRWATFPSVAELREAASETMRGQVKELSPAEAWDLAWGAVAYMDPEQEGSVARVTAGLPPLVVETMQAFGVPALCYGKEPVGVIRGQFLKMFEQLAARDRRMALLPASLKHAIASIGSIQPALPASALTSLAHIGVEP